MMSFAAARSSERHAGSGGVRIRDSGQRPALGQGGDLGAGDTGASQLAGLMLPVGSIDATGIGTTVRSESY